MKKKKGLIIGLSILVAGLVFLPISIFLLSVLNERSAYKNQSYDRVRSEKVFETPGEFEKKMDEAYYPEMDMGDESAEISVYTASYVNSAGVQKEKLIIRNSLVIETKDFQTYLEALEKLVFENSAYIQEQNVYNGSLSGNEVRNAFYVIRVPKNKAAGFSSALRGLEGKVTRQEINVENVTQRYLDVQRRVDINKAKEDRLAELLKKAKNMKDLISIEKEIASLVTERESMQSELIELDHDVSYDYYSLSINEVREYQEVKAKKSFGADIAYAFDSSISGFVHFLQNIVLFFVYTWIFWLIMVIIAVILVRIIKKKAKKNIDTVKEK